MSRRSDSVLLFLTLLAAAIPSIYADEPADLRYNDIVEQIPVEDPLREFYIFAQADLHRTLKMDATAVHLVKVDLNGDGEDEWFLSTPNATNAKA